MRMLEKRLVTFDGLGLVVGIMVGSGIFRTPGTVVAILGRPGLTFVAWSLGGLVGLLGALVFAELATRHPQAGGKYVYAREAYGRRMAFVVGWVEALVYCVAIAAIATVCGDYLSRVCGWSAAATPRAAVALLILLTALNLIGVRTGTLAQNAVTTAKVLALAAVPLVALVAGTGTAWSERLPSAPAGPAVFGAVAVAFQSVIWTYYGYQDAAKVAEEVKDPHRSLPRIFLLGIGSVTALYLLLNAAFFQVVPLARIASSTLVVSEVAESLFGPRAGAVVSALALVVVLGSLNGNLFVTPRVIFGLARDGLGPAVLTEVNRGGTPWTAMLLVGGVSALLAATGSFERLLSLAVTFILVMDGFMVLVLFRLRRREPQAPFRIPLYPLVPLLFLATYGLLLAGALVQQRNLTLAALGILVSIWAGSALLVGRNGGPAQPTA